MNSFYLCQTLHLLDNTYLGRTGTQAASTAYTTAYMILTAGINEFMQHTLPPAIALYRPWIMPRGMEGE
jgi:hypothetical protein